MRAYRFDDFQGLESLQLHNEDRPVPQRNELLLRVHAVSLNFRDIAIVRGRYPRSTKPGLIPTSDAACEVVAVGDQVRDFSPGDRVVSAFHPRWFGGSMPATVDKESYGSGQDGWLVEYKAVCQDAVVSLPSNLSFEEGATLPCAGVTAWNALSGSSPIRAGHTVLTLGSGGVSVFALQLAKSLGAQVIATTSSAVKAERLQGLGADLVINYVEHKTWSEQVRGLTQGRGVDRVVEVGGPATLHQSLKAVAAGGEVVLIGFLSQENPDVDYFAIKGADATLRSIAVGDRTHLQELVRVVARSSWRPVIDKVFSFGETRAAFAHLEAGKHMGKVVIRL